MQAIKTALLEELAPHNLDETTFNAYFDPIKCKREYFKWQLRYMLFCKRKDLDVTKHCSVVAFLTAHDPEEYSPSTLWQHFSFVEKLFLVSYVANYMVLI